RGHGLMEVQQIYTQARELCRQAGETSQLFPVLWGLTVNAIVKGEILLHPGIPQKRKARGVLMAGRAVVRSQLLTRMPHQQKRLSQKERESSKATGQQ